MTDLCLHIIFNQFWFANTNLPLKRYIVCGSKTEIKQLPKSSTDISKTNMLGRYKDRPTNTLESGKQ